MLIVLTDSENEESKTESVKTFRGRQKAKLVTTDFEISAITVDIELLLQSGFCVPSTHALGIMIVTP